MDDEDAYQEELDLLISEISEDRGKAILLFDDLADLSHSDSIELREVKFSIRSERGATIVSVTNNGYINGEGNRLFIDQLNTMISDVFRGK